MKGQGSLEFLTVVGIATVISAPFILEAQSLVTSTSETSDITGFQSSLDELVKKIERVDAMGSPAADSVRLDIPAGITEARVISTGTKESSTAIVFTRNRSSQLNNYTRFVEADLQTNDLPTEEGSRKIGIKALNREVKLSYDIFSADFVALDLIEQDSEVTFKDTSETLGNILTNYTWYVNDSIVKSGSSADTLEHLTDEDTDYNITLKIESSEGDTDQISKTYNPDVNRALLFTVKSQSQWNQGIFSGTSADRNDNSGDLGLGYLNGSNPSPTNLEEGLIGYWRMDRNIDGSGGNVIDYSGEGNNGSTSGGVDTGSQGVLGTDSFDFADDDDDYINYGEKYQFDDTDRFTVSFWINTDKVDANDRALGFDSTNGWGFLYLNFETGRDELGFRADGDVYLGKNEGIAEVEDGWTHVAVTSNGSGGLKMFENALKLDTAESASWTEPDDIFVVGDSGNGDTARWAGQGDNFDGSIDEVRIYNRTLTNREINRLYLKRNPVRGEYKSKNFENSQEKDWNTLEVQASVPSSTELTARFQTLKDSFIYSLEQEYDSITDWDDGLFSGTTNEKIITESEKLKLLNLDNPSSFEGSFIGSTADEVVSEFRSVSEQKISGESGFNSGTFTGSTADEVITEYNYPSELEALSQEGFNQGSYDRSSADRSDNSGDLGLGYSNGTAGDDLIGYWRLDRNVNGDGDTVKDYSGEGIDGTTQNGVNTGISGVFSTNAHDFDGSSDYIDLGEPNNLKDESLEPAFTTTAWIKLDEVNTDQWQVILGKGSDNNNDNYALFEEDGILKAYRDGSGISESFYVNGAQGTDLTTDTWYFVAHAIEMDELSDADGSSWSIGKHGERTTLKRNLNGSIDEVRVYDQRLSQEKIEDLYFRGMDGSFEGGYVAERIDNSQETSWESLEVDASVPSDTSVTVTFKALDGSGGLVDSQTFDLGGGLQNYTLNVDNSEDAEVVVNGSSSDVTKTWEIHGLQVFSEEVEDRVDGLRIGYRNGTISDDLEAYFRFDGSSAQDYSGNNLQPTIDGSPDKNVQNGLFGTNMWGFYGDSEKLDYVGLDIGSDWTVSVWFPYPNGELEDTSHWRTLTRGDAGDHQALVEEGTYNLGTYDNTDGQNFLDCGYDVNSLSDGLHNLVVRQTGGTSGTMEFYIDGNKKCEVSDYGSTTDIRSIGNYYGGGQEFGELDEFRFYSRALSNQEINEIYFHGSDGDFNGDYVAERISNSRETRWSSLEVNASVPSGTSVNASFRALDGSGSLVDSQTVDLSESLKNYSLTVSNSENAEVFINGSSSNVMRTWEIDSLEVFSREVEEKNDGLRIGYRNGSLGDDLVGYWRMDRSLSGDGSTMRDYSGENNDGTLSTGGNMVSGVPGTFSTNASELDGSDDYVDIPKLGFSGDTSITTTAWVKVDPSAGSKNNIFGFGNAGNGNEVYSIRTKGDGGWRFYFWGNDLDASTSNYYGEWTHVAAVYDAGNSNRYIYMNGTKVASDSPSNPNFQDNTYKIGGFYSEYFDGKIDEVRIYNRSLPPSEVKDLYFNGRPFQGNYTAKKIDNSQKTSWDSLEVNASIPSDTSVSASFRALDSNGDLVDSQTVDLSEGLQNYSLSISNSEDAEVFINGTSSNVTKTWKVHDLEVHAKAVENEISDLRIGYQNKSSAEGLIGYWRLDRNVSGSGEIVRDYSGEGNDGVTRNGVGTGYEGILNSQAMNFDSGVSGDVKVPDIGSELNAANQFTVSYWINYDSFSDYKVAYGNGNTDSKFWTEPYRDGNAGNSISVEDQSGTRHRLESGEVINSMGEWYHVAYSWDGRHLRAYTDGSKVGELDTGGVSLDLPSDHYIGSYNLGNAGDNNDIDGRMDEIRIYNRSLSSTEINDLYFNGRPFKGNYTAQKVDMNRKTKWRKVEVNASVPADTDLNGEFQALDLEGNVVDSQEFSVSDGIGNYSLDVADSKEARLKFIGSSSNVSRGWKVFDHKIYSGEREVNESESFRVTDGLNEFNLDVDPSKDARVELNGSTSNVEDSWIVESLSVFN